MNVKLFHNGKAAKRAQEREPFIERDPSKGTLESRERTLGRKPKIQNQRVREREPERVKMR